MKRLIAIFLSIIFVSTTVTEPLTVEAHSGGVTTAEFNNSLLSNDYTINGTDSVGRMISTVLSAETEEQLANNGCNIFSVEMEGMTATVEYETVEEASIVVAVYEEDGIKMLASGKTDVSVDARVATVTIETEQMPEFFYLRAFLMGRETLAPLCVAYESPNYTQEMQAFFATTTEDFDEELIVNLDDDATNNFMVLDEEVVRVSEETGTNILLSADDEQLIYTFGNVDETITALQPGDIFSYEKDDGSLLIITISSVTIADGIATVVGQDTTLEEAFEFIKIDAESYTPDAEIDAAEMEDGVSYDGISEINEYDDSGIQGVSLTQDKGYIKPMALDVNLGELKLGANFTLDKKWKDDSGLSVTVSGKLGLKFGVSTKLYLSASYKYVELKINYSLSGELGIKGALSAKEIPLAFFAFSPVPMVVIEFRPCVVFEFSADLTFKGTISGTEGFSYETEEGIKSLQSAPQVATSEIKGEVSFFMGLSMEPKVYFASDKIAEITLKAKAGCEISGKRILYNSDDEHICDVCIDGDIKGKVDFSAAVNLLNHFKAQVSLSYSVKLKDWYYSFDYGDFGWGECPHKKSSEDDPSQGGGNIEDNTDYNSLSVVDVSMGQYHSAVLLSDGSLWLWGNNEYGQIGDGTTDNVKQPKKILNGVSAVSLGDYHSAVIMQNGDLYLWGKNTSYQLGFNDKNASYYEPQKLMENVKEVACAGAYTIALLKDGRVFSWGDDGKPYSSWPHATPNELLSEVKHIASGSTHSAAIKSDGSLYLWGNNAYAQIGNGERATFCQTPFKALENVQEVSLGEAASAAILTNGDVYTWGYAFYGLGTSKEGGYYLTPQKIYSSVKSISLRYGEGLNGDKDSRSSLDGILVTESNDACCFGHWQRTPQKEFENIIFAKLGRDRVILVNTENQVYTYGNEYGGAFLGLGGEQKSVQTPTRILFNNITNSAKKYQNRSYVILVDTDSNKTENYDGLTPNNLYYFYDIADKTAEDLLAPSNLLYIGSGASDDAGTLSILYEPRLNLSGTEAFVVGYGEKPDKDDSGDKIFSRYDKDADDAPIGADIMEAMAGERAAEQIAFTELGEYGYYKDISIDVPASMLQRQASGSPVGTKAVLLQYDDVINTFALTDNGVVVDGNVTFSISEGANYALVYAVNGDTTNDGLVDIEDLLNVLYHSSKRKLMSPLNVGIADTNGDNEVDIEDVLATLYYTSGRKSSL